MRRALSLTLISLLTAAALSADVSLVERQTARRSLVEKSLVKKPKAPKRLHHTSAALVDASGLQYFLNTNVTDTAQGASSASGAASDASYSTSVHATTSGGGTQSSALTDAFDGYSGLCISQNGTVALCSYGDPNFEIYSQNGPATTECPGATVNRQLVFPPRRSAASRCRARSSFPTTTSSPAG